MDNFVLSYKYFLKQLIHFLVAQYFLILDLYALIVVQVFWSLALLDLGFHWLYWDSQKNLNYNNTLKSLEFYWDFIQLFVSHFLNYWKKNYYFKRFESLSRCLIRLSQHLENISQVMEMDYSVCDNFSYIDLPPLYEIVQWVKIR